MNKKTIMVILLTSLAFSSFAYAGNGSGNEGGGNGNGGSESGSGNPSVGPQGPQGNTGSNGKDGTNGVNGLNGASGVNGTNGLDAVDKSRFLGELDLRLWDTKHTSFYAFDSYGFNDAPNQDVVLDGRNAFYGFKFVVKLGSSYEERLAEKQDARIKALEAALAKLSK